MNTLAGRIKTSGEFFVSASSHLFRKSSGSFATFAAILRAYRRFRKVFIMIFVVGQMFAKNSKQKLWLFVLYLFDPKFLKMAPSTHNVATNKINRSHCADRTR
jgi:hypothetical protein